MFIDGLFWRVRLMSDGVRLLLEIADYPILRLQQFIIDGGKDIFTNG
jgi:hypothetical protein